MDLPPIKQRQQNHHFFGLLDSRLLHRNNSAPKAPETRVSAAVREGREARERALAELQAGIDVYNAVYGEKPETGGESFHYEMLPRVSRRADLNRLETRITEIILLKADQAGVTRENWRATAERDSQWTMLNTLRHMVEAIKGLPQVADVERQARRTQLSRLHEGLTASLEKQKVWKKSPLYDEMDAAFDRLADTSDFRDIWKSPEGLTTENQREAKMLFLAMMAGETRDFKEIFVFGDTFGDDAEANIVNFPFLYNEFLKLEGNAIAGEAVTLEKIAASESEVALRKRNAAAKRPANAIVEANPAAGLTRVTEQEPGIPATQAWEERLTILIRNIRNLEERASKETDQPLRSGWQQSAEEMQVHVEHTKACLQLSRLKDREKIVRGRFIRGYFSQREGRKTMIELAVKKFAKAMNMVDRPLENANWQYLLHPTVRRLAIASIYDGGVANYKKDAEGNVTYNENLKAEHSWMMSTLVLSPYFNLEEEGKNMSVNHEAALKAVYLGGKIASLLEASKPTVEVLDAWIKVKTEADTYTEGSERDAFIKQQMEYFPPHLVARFENDTPDQLKNTRGQVVAERQRLNGFLEKTKNAVKNPYSSEALQFFAEMQTDQYATVLSQDIENLGKIGVISGASYEAYINQMNQLQLNFKTAERQEGNIMMYFEALGLRIEGVHRKYLHMIQKNPKLKVEFWDHILLTGNDAQFKELTDLFQIILSEEAGGKKDFIEGLVSIRRKYKGEKNMPRLMSSLQEGSEDAVILNTLRMLVLHLGQRTDTAAFSDLKIAEIDEQSRGAHIGDKISKYVGGVWEMLTGPGQTLANRAAGFVLMYGFYKSARMAMKGDSKAGKMFRMLYVAGAVEMAAKNITGRGFLDRLGMDSIAGAMEGTYEEVLRQDAEAHMEAKEITPEAHGVALMELNDVPFHQVMKWYENCDPNGMPQPPGSADYFPRQIDLDRIAPKVTWNAKDKQREARRVVWHTVRHFFGYVGQKANWRDTNQGKNELKERWIDYFSDPNKEPAYSRYDHREFFKASGIKQNDITWQLVMRSEIDPKQVDLTKGKTPFGRFESTAREGWEGMTGWIREHVYNPGSGHAETFFESLGEGKQDAKKFLDEVYHITKRKVYFGKERVILWYGEHKYEIKRTLDNHWQLLATGLTLPFKLVVAVDDWAIPWSLQKLKVVEESLRTKRLEVINTEEDITVREIYEGLPQNLGSDNLNLNPKFARYGIYQEPFVNAMLDIGRNNNTGEIVSSVERPRGNWFYREPGMNTGYFISEVTVADAGIDMSDPLYSGNEAAVNSKMIEASREKARQRFRNEGMSYEEIDRYMYAIHEIKYTRLGKMYIFWRMPLKESVELYLKETGRWPDYNDPNRLKEREYWVVDQNKSSWENLKDGFMLDMDGTRKVLSGAGGYVAQVPRFAFWNVEWIGGVISTIGGEFSSNPRFKEDMDAKLERPPFQRQFIDEFFTSAGSENLALSDFYKDPVNAKLYKFALDSAQNQNRALFLGYMKGRTSSINNEAYEGTLYLEGGPDIYAEMWEYYRKNWEPANGPDADIEAALTGALPEPPPAQRRPLRR